MSIALDWIPMPMGRFMHDILDTNHSLVCRDDSLFLALVNKMGEPRGAFFTFVTYLGSNAFWTY